MNFIRKFAKWILGVGFILAGINHFINPNFYLKIMPPYLPWHLFLVYLSGVLEVIFGGLLFIPRFTRFAAWGIIAILIAVFPANVYMAMNPQNFPEFSTATLHLRLPLQFLLIGWAYWYTKKCY
ncbi:MAG TPA: MauE/DoxX family redox-associated membrane protein [Pyrinomonadaceae bacterium]|jgi:uncharacterized membrane protein